MNTQALNSLADLICRAQTQNRTPMGIAFAIDAAGRHMSPETAAELERLRARVAELETERHTTNEALSDAAETLRTDRDRITELYQRIEAERPETARNHRCNIPLTRRHDCGHCPHEVCEDCGHCPHMCGCGTPAGDVSPQVQKLRGILARQREDVYESPLRHDYATPHDLPEMTP